jgi:DNA-binding IscR family transcriptional regulator
MLRWISAKRAYAVRALLGLAAHQPELVKAEILMSEQSLPQVRRNDPE